MLITRLFVVSCVLGVAFGDSEDDPLISGVKLMYRTIRLCDDGDLLTCLKMRALKSMEKIMQQDEVSLIEGVTFQKVEDSRKGDSGRGLESPPLNEVDEQSLPDDPVMKDNTLDQLLFDRVSRFLSSHTLKINMAKYLDSSAITGRGNEGFGGGKGGGGGGGKKGGGVLLLLGSMMAGGMGAIALKGLALLAGKALIIAKMALVLSAVIGLSKLLHHGHDKHYEVVGHGGGGYDRIGYGRGINDFHSHVLAYGGQVQANEKSPPEPVKP